MPEAVRTAISFGCKSYRDLQTLQPLRRHQEEGKQWSRASSCFVCVCFFLFKADGTDGI